MRGFNRRNGRLPRFYAIQKIPAMVGRMVELNLPFIFRLGEPIHIGSFVPSPVHPDPAIGADPFSAAPNIRISTCNRHSDVLWIFKGDAVLGASVPDSVLWRELAYTFDLGRAVVVEVEPPMGDVAMMADPIQQLAAAGIVVPTPIHVNAAFNVRFHFRWPNPEFIIQALRGTCWGHFIFCLREIGVAVRQADLDLADLADKTVANNCGSFAELATFGTLPGTGLPDAFILLNRLYDGLLFGDGAGERVLPVDIFFLIGGLDCS